MEGIQKTVHIGLLKLASNVEKGVYGKDDEAFADDEDSLKSLAQQFLNDIHDEILDKMQ